MLEAVSRFLSFANLVVPKWVMSPKFVRFTSGSVRKAVVLEILI